ncbi:MAG TPA: tetratricopeptide repeat protein, partial [Vicinamibacterales bacterium]|nr:tetratricopeptide repeat protein [Vicinamibacterales bacterium]
AGSYRAAFNLARLYEHLGDTAQYEALLQTSIELNPRFPEGHFYLAKLLLDRNRDLERAAALALRGLQFGGASPMAPLGHYVLADIYNRQGRHADAAREVARGRRLERKVDRSLNR